MTELSSWIKIPWSRWAEAAAYKSVACEIASESTAPFVTDPSADVFIWGKSKMSLTEKLDVRGILISSNLTAQYEEGLHERRKKFRSIKWHCIHHRYTAQYDNIRNGSLLPLFHWTMVQLSIADFANFFPVYILNLTFSPIRNRTKVGILHKNVYCSYFKYPWRTC